MGGNSTPAGRAVLPPAVCRAVLLWPGHHRGCGLLGRSCSWPGQPQGKCTLQPLYTHPAALRTPMNALVRLPLGCRNWSGSTAAHSSSSRPSANVLRGTWQVGLSAFIFRPCSREAWCTAHLTAAATSLARSAAICRRLSSAMRCFSSASNRTASWMGLHARGATLQPPTPHPPTPALSLSAIRPRPCSHEMDPHAALTTSAEKE